jgi:type I protein arginine methyltransferase
MYSVHFYGQMLADAPRMDAYAAALRRAVKPDSVVMDLGSGPGVFAMLACKLGARRVYAVEPDNVIGLAREAAAANGVADRIEFFENFSTEIDLPEPASVVVSDLRGVLPWFQQHLPSIIDARKRLLARDGVLIPQRDVLWAAVVEAPDEYEELVGPWQKNKFDLDLSAGTRFVTNRWRKTRLKPEQLLAEPICWTAIDYYEVDSPNIQAQIFWRAARRGTAHGVAVWFDSELAEGIGFSNHPATTEMIYGNGLFPFSEPVEVMEGDRIELRLSAKMVHDDYVWRWDTDFFANSDETRPRVSFKQSTFFGTPLSPAQLQKLRQ